MQAYDDNEDPLDPKRKLFDALAGPGATAKAPGIAAGDANPNAGPAPVLDQPIPSPAGPAAPVQDFSRLVGYDQGKFNDPNKQSAKYQIGRTLSGFDSTKGLTPEAIAALNGLGFGSYTGQGDKLSLSGLTDKGRQAGLVGDFKDADFNVGFKSGNGKWGYADPAEEARVAAEGGGASPAGGGGGMSLTSLDPLLSGDPMAKIQAALSKLQGPRDNAEALMAALGGR